MRATLGLLAEIEVDRIKARVRDAFDMKKARGEKLGGPTPYGYNVKKYKCKARRRLIKVLRPDKVELAVMRYISYLRDHCVMRLTRCWSLTTVAKQFEIATPLRAKTIPMTREWLAWHQPSLKAITEHMRRLLLRDDHPKASKALKAQHRLRAKSRLLHLLRYEEVRQAYLRWTNDFKPKWPAMMQPTPDEKAKVLTE